eukprot:scaffold1504_cov417-Prasinococcus_capsulatus_cf.AAC.66
MREVKIPGRCLDVRIPTCTSLPISEIDNQSLFYIVGRLQTLTSNSSVGDRKESCWGHRSVATMSTALIPSPLRACPLKLSRRTSTYRAAPYLNNRVVVTASVTSGGIKV